MPEIIFNGPAGRLEGRYSHARTSGTPLALVLHPHPEQGGTMNNRITYTMFQAFAQRGFSTLRFNYRGVGRSQGSFDRGEGELADAASALDWLQSVNPSAPFVWIGGFSFGAWIGMQLLMRRPEIRGFISVAPPTNIYDFGFLAPCPASGLIVHGSQDTVVPEPSVDKLVQKLRSQRGISIDYRIVDSANHFFNNHVDLLTAHMHDYMNGAHGGSVAPASARKAA